MIAGSTTEGKTMQIPPTPAPLVTLDELDQVLYSRAIDSDEFCDIAMKCDGGDTAKTVDALIEGVLSRYGDVLDEAACAALNAVRCWHVPLLQDAMNDMGQHRRAA